jgi:motility quorum-sensing regulator/GCU-specific mRNA interferase toxin
MEKRKRTYDLEAIKQGFTSVSQLGLSITGTAFRNAQELGFTREDIVTAIKKLKPSNFYKSMTSHAEHKYGKMFIT